MVSYTLRIRRIAPEKRSLLERMLPSCDAVTFNSDLDQTSYTFSYPVSKRQILKITKIIMNLDVPYWQFEKPKN